VSVQQVLWAGGRIDAGIAAADARMVAASSGTLVEEQTVLERTVGAYVELQRQQTRLLASQDNVRRHEDLYGLISRRVGQEVSSAADSALALARLAQARAERQQIFAAIGNARAALQSLSGETVQTVVGFDAPPLGFASVQEAMAAAERFSPEIGRQRSLADAAASDLDVRKGQLLPSLAARFEHLRNPIIGVHSSIDRALLSFEFQPGAGLSSLSAVREAEARRLAAFSAVESARLELEQKLNSAWIDAQSSAMQREPLRLLARTNAAIVDSFLRQYRVGRKNWLDVMNAQREAVQARYSLADIDAQALSGALRVRIVSGTLSAETLESLVLNPLPALDPPSPLNDSTIDANPRGPSPDEFVIPRMTR
jgi:adhesin transport system outer membrane protein